MKKLDLGNTSIWKFVNCLRIWTNWKYVIWQNALILDGTSHCTFYYMSYWLYEELLWQRLYHHKQVIRYGLYKWFFLLRLWFSYYRQKLWWRPLYCKHPYYILDLEQTSDQRNHTSILMKLYWNNSKHDLSRIRYILYNF